MEFNDIRRLVMEQSAIVLEEDKGRLVESRLSPLARREGFASSSQLLEKVNLGLPASLLVSYFQKRDCDWHWRDVIRRRVDYPVLNPASAWAFILPVDIVKMRNVLIYFAIENKKEILTKIRRVLKPDGDLFLGAAEGNFNIDDSYEPVSLERATGYRIRAN